MVTRQTILAEAIDKCRKELYQYAMPHVKWEDFVLENKVYNKCLKEWEQFCQAEINKDTNMKAWKEKQIQYPEWIGKTCHECIGPAPYDFYYLPEYVFKDIVDSYIYAYEIDHHEELINTIDVLQNYCKEPIVEEYVQDEDNQRSTKEYVHPDNLEKTLAQYISEHKMSDDPEKSATEIQKLFFKFLDMAGKFYKWNYELSQFNSSIYLGSAPSYNKDEVIKNWKKYRGKDIEIDDKQIKLDYYGDEDYEI